MQKQESCMESSFYFAYNFSFARITRSIVKRGFEILHPQKKLRKNPLFSFSPNPTIGRKKESTMYDVRTQNTEWNPQPPKKMNPVAKWAAIISGGVILLVVALVAMAAAASSTGTSQISNAANTPSPKASASAPAPVHKQTPQEWLAGPGGDALKAVEQDLTTISTDASDYDTVALEEDGQQLADDAKAARELSPPAPLKHEYRMAMHDFQRAGNLLVADDVIESTTLIASGTEHIANATTALTG